MRGQRLGQLGYRKGVRQQVALAEVVDGWSVLTLSHDSSQVDDSWAATFPRIGLVS